MIPLLKINHIEQKGFDNGAQRQFDIRVSSTRVCMAALVYSDFEFFGRPMSQGENVPSEISI